jgi:hypothetical protein
LVSTNYTKINNNGFYGNHIYKTTGEPIQFNTTEMTVATEEKPAGKMRTVGATTFRILKAILWPTKTGIVLFTTLNVMI